MPPRPAGTTTASRRQRRGATEWEEEDEDEDEDEDPPRRRRHASIESMGRKERSVHSESWIELTTLRRFASTKEGRYSSDLFRNGYYSRAPAFPSTRRRRSKSKEKNPFASLFQPMIVSRSRFIHPHALVENLHSEFRSTIYSNLHEDILKQYEDHLGTWEIECDPTTSSGMTSSGSVHGICSPVIRRRLSAFSLGFRISSMDWNSSSPMLEDPTREHALQEGRTESLLLAVSLSPPLRRSQSFGGLKDEVLEDLQDSYPTPNLPVVGADIPPHVSFFCPRNVDTNNFRTEFGLQCSLFRLSKSEPIISVRWVSGRKKDISRYGLVIVCFPSALEIWDVPVRAHRAGCKPLYGVEESQIFSYSFSRSDDSFPSTTLNRITCFDIQRANNCGLDSVNLFRVAVGFERGNVEILSLHVPVEIEIPISESIKLVPWQSLPPCSSPGSVSCLQWSQLHSEEIFLLRCASSSGAVEVFDVSGEREFSSASFSPIPVLFCYTLSEWISNCYWVPGKFAFGAVTSGSMRRVLRSGQSSLDNNVSGKEGHEFSGPRLHLFASVPCTYRVNKMDSEPSRKLYCVESFPREEILVSESHIISLQEYSSNVQPTPLLTEIAQQSASCSYNSDRIYFGTTGGSVFRCSVEDGLEFCSLKSKFKHADVCHKAIERLLCWSSSPRPTQDPPMQESLPKFLTGACLYGPYFDCYSKSDEERVLSDHSISSLALCTTFPDSSLELFATGTDSGLLCIGMIESESAPLGSGLQANARKDDVDKSWASLVR